jgi:hypothetical protein
MLPEQAGAITAQTDVVFGDYPSRTFLADPITRQIRVIDDGAAVMRQAVEVILGVERYRYQIYSPNFGVELDGLIGNDIGFVKSELRRRLIDAFIPDRRITGASDFVFMPIGTDALDVRFTVNTVFGNIPASLEVPV